MERQFRELDDATKLRISQKLRGRSMSDSHKQAISNSMKVYWDTVPNKPQQQNNTSKNQLNNEKNMQKKSND